MTSGKGFCRSTGGRYQQSDLLSVLTWKCYCLAEDSGVWPLGEI